MATPIIPKINEQSFFDKVRASLFGGKLTAKQVEGMAAILTEWNKRQLCDIRWLGYMLATTLHETARRMEPIEEFGKGKGYDYGKKLKMSRKSYTTPDKLYYGRGQIQLTWYENYSNLGKRLGVDLLNKPELALDLKISTQILFEGMIYGLFTGKKLSDYFLGVLDDPLNARKIINGKDKAELIKGYHQKFLSALT